MEKVNIVLGRFQPFTIGHLKCCTNVFKQRGLKTVLCVIDTIKPDEKHPFLTKIMWSGFKGLVKEYEEICDVVLIKSADILKIGEAVAQKGYSVATWSCGTDRIDAYTRMCKKYAPEVDVIEIHREDSDVSGTQVRKLIAEGKEDQFKELTPKPMWKLFPQFKAALEALQ
jgi:nicotinamide mononucleotide adenylyltransferase